VNDHTMVIDGKAVAPTETFGVINPATGKVFAHAPDCSPEQLDHAMRAAAAAFPGWQIDMELRRHALLAAAEAIEDAAGELAPLLTAEQGKPLADARFEVGLTAAGLRHTAELDLPREILQDDQHTRIEVGHGPMGVIAAITPWNFPLGLATLKIGPALLAGNTVVLKPSPFTPLSTLALGEIVQDLFPPGVLNVISGRDPLGAQMTEHPVPRKISFTGSVATGKRVAAAAAPDLKRLTLELGGNDAAILLEDVDLDAFADRLLWGALVNCGQICLAIKRIYAPRARYAEVVEALTDRARSIVVGDGMAPDTQLGPLNNAPLFARVRDLLAGAVTQGATAAGGGGPEAGDGYFFRPTILSGAVEGMRIVDEEQFGPVLPVIAYDDVEDALVRANASRFGLGGSVWSADLERATAVARRLECGTSWINAHAVPSPMAPIGGHKWSGMGIEGGLPGLLEFTEIKVLHTMKG
jgi:acyl-CoA reductase-like NAD-dependent aldehyde dehydrogenase